MPKRTCPRPENRDRFRSLSNRRFSFPSLPIGLLETQRGIRHQIAARAETTGYCLASRRRRFAAEGSLERSSLVSDSAKMRFSNSISAMVCSASIASQISTTRAARSMPAIFRQMNSRAWRCVPSHRDRQSPTQDHPPRSQRRTQCCFRTDKCPSSAGYSVVTMVEP